VANRMRVGKMLNPLPFLSMCLMCLSLE